MPNVNDDARIVGVQLFFHNILLILLDLYSDVRSVDYIVAVFSIICRPSMWFFIESLAINISSPGIHGRPLRTCLPILGVFKFLVAILIGVRRYITAPFNIISLIVILVIFYFKKFPIIAIFWSYIVRFQCIYKSVLIKTE